MQARLEAYRRVLCFLRAHPFRVTLPAVGRRRVRAHLRAIAGGRAIGVVQASIVRCVAVVTQQTTARYRALSGRAVPACAAIGVDATIARHAGVVHEAAVWRPMARAGAAGRAVGVLGAGVVGADTAGGTATFLDAATVRAGRAVVVVLALPAGCAAVDGAVAGRLCGLASGVARAVVGGHAPSVDTPRQGAATAHWSCIRLCRRRPAASPERTSGNQNR
jgi:hypothetical protein